MTRLHVVGLCDSEYAYDVYDRLSEAYDSNNVTWVVENSMLLVWSTDDSTAIADSAGLSENQPGLVFRLRSGYTGYMPRDFWKWLRDK